MQPEFFLVYAPKIEFYIDDGCATCCGFGPMPPQSAPRTSANENTVWFKFFSWTGRIWGRFEQWYNRVTARFRRERRQLGAEMRLLSAEVIQLGAKVWDAVDDLPLIPKSFKLKPVKTQFYGHGAFMGAAPALLADPTWRRILAFLMPDVFEALKNALAAGKDHSQIMPMMENNPVAAAFGVFHGARFTSFEAESPHHLSGIEWDLFVDSELLERWEQVRGNPEKMAVIMDTVIDTSLIAHANSTDTVQENMGICQFRDVRKTPKTEMGGVEIDSWLDFFARALELAQSPDLAETVAQMAQEPRSNSVEACMLHTFAPTWPVARAVDVYRRITKKPCLSIIIDIKSLRSTPEFLSDLIVALNTIGIHVSAVGSFLREEVEGVGETRQVIDGVEYPAAREIQFFHFAGDLQSACDEGRIARGQSVLFNGASLLDSVESDAGLPVYSVKLGVVSEIEEYRKKYDLHIGYYVQEGDCDCAAVALLSDLDEARPETFELGFAWGGLRDEAHLDASHTARLGYGAQRMLEYVGKAKQWQITNKNEPPLS